MHDRSSASGIGTALRSNPAFTALTAAVADAVLIVADSGEVLYASERVRDLLDRDTDTLIGGDFLDLFHEDDRAEIPAQMEGGGPGVQWTARMLQEDGWRWVSLGLRKPDGAEPEGTYVFVRPLDTPPEVTDAAVLFQRALDAANNLVVITDPRRDDNPIVFVNDHFLDVTGYEEEEVLGKNCRFLQFRADGTRDEQPERDVLRRNTDSGEPSTVLMRNYRKDGSRFWNELYVTPLHDAEGALTHFIGVQNDVTQRVEAQQKTERGAALLRSFYDSAPMMMGVVELGEDGTVTHRSANRAAATFYELEPDEVRGKTEGDLGYTDAESQRWQRHYREALASDTPVRFDTVYPWDEDPGGEGVRHLAVVLNRIAEADEPPLFSYIVEDVTERRQSEQSRRLLEQAVESTTAAFLITERRLDLPGPRVTYVNPAFSKMTGYQREDIVGDTPRLLQGPKTDRALLDRLRRQLGAGESFHGETINYRKDGSEYVLNWSIEPIHAPDGTITHWVATQNDVTAQRKLEQDVLEVTAREQERIARDLHDGLGQVLTGVSFLAASAERRLRAEGSAHAEDLAQIKAHVEEAIEQARDLARGLHPVDAEPDGLVNALGRLADTVEATYGVSCTFIYDRPVLVTEHSAAAHLYRIVQEATSNAVRHGRAQTIEIVLAHVDKSDEPLGDAVLSVRDDGTGISDRALNESRGMGLYTMRNRARYIGGTIEIGPRSDGGTVVTCRFDPNGAAADAEG